MTKQEYGHIEAIKCNCGAIFSYSIDDSITAISRAETEFRSNVLYIAEGGEYEVQTFKLKQMYNRSKIVHFSTKPSLLAICCYVPFFFTNLN